LIETIDASLTDLKPARLEHGVGRAIFAMNRRVYREDRVDFGENPEGPIDWEVPVLKVKGTNDTVRAILFGYACHGTSISGDDFTSCRAITWLMPGSRSKLSILGLWRCT
jgi:hypothetical protein